MRSSSSFVFALLGLVIASSPAWAIDPCNEAQWANADGCCGEGGAASCLQDAEAGTLYTCPGDGDIYQTDENGCEDSVAVPELADGGKYGYSPIPTDDKVQPPEEDEAGDCIRER